MEYWQALRLPWCQLLTSDLEFRSLGRTASRLSLEVLGQDPVTLAVTLRSRRFADKWAESTAIAMSDARAQPVGAGWVERGVCSRA